MRRSGLRGGLVLLVLGLATSAWAEPSNGLEATLRLVRRPVPGARSLDLELGLRNVSHRALSIAPGNDEGWILELHEPGEQLGCSPMPTARHAFRLAPRAARHWRVVCRVIEIQSHQPARMRAGPHAIRAVFGIYRAKPKGRIASWTGQTATAPLAFEVPPRPGEKEPALDAIAPLFDLDGCTVAVEDVRLYRYFEPPPQLCGARAPPVPPSQPGEKAPTAEVLDLRVLVDNHAARSCQLVYWQAFAHGVDGTPIPLRPSGMPSPRQWEVEAAAGHRTAKEVRAGFHGLKLVPETRYVLTFSLEDAAGRRAWLKTVPIRFSPPEENPVTVEPRKCDPRIP